MNQPTPTEAKLLAAIAERDERLAAQEIRIRLLEQKIDALVRRLFGAKSEKLDPAQLLLILGGIDSPGKSGEPAGEAKPLRCSEKEPASLPRRKPRKERLPEHLPVVEEIIEPEAVKAEPTQWRQIGQEISERLDYEPARFYRLRTVRPKYVQRNDADAAPVIAPLPAFLQERASVGPGLLAQVVVGKYCDHLPLYRQADIYWRRHGVWLPRQTLCGWIELAAQWLKPIYELIRREILAEGCVQVDETPIRYLKAGNGKCRQGYLWACAKPRGDVVFHWQTSRAADCLDTILPVNFNGIVQCDGYQAYQAMARERKGVELGSCMAHVRRKIAEAQAQAPKTAAWLLRQIQHLYRVESVLRKNRAGPALRQANRSSQSRPILERLRKAFVRLHIAKRYLPQSAMSKAIQYALGQWEGFDVFVRDGRVELDNNHVENAIRPTAVGKRNWLFVGNAQAGARSAILYTVIEACRRRGIDPYGYLRDVFARLPTMTNWQLEALLPSNWSKARRSTIAEMAA